MKTNIILIFILSILVVPVFAQKIVTTNIKVFGNCGMCKQRIERSLDHTGIKSAIWNVETKNLEVVYNSEKINEEKIHALIAAAGHDTEKSKSKDEVYAKLPFCCLYRDHDHSGIKDEEDHHDHHQ